MGSIVENTAWFEKIPLGELPERAAKQWGTREALMFQGKRWGFEAVSAEVDRVARGLMAAGIKPGDKVALWLMNGPEWIHIMFAIFRIGAVLVPVNTRLRTLDVAYILKQSEASVLVAPDVSGPIDYYSMMTEVLPTLKNSALDGKSDIDETDYPQLKKVVIVSENPQPGTLHWPDLLANGEQVSQSDMQARAQGVNPNDPVFIMYTSGTTGFPKGVLHTHALYRNVSDRASRMGITQNDVILNYLPLFHMFGFSEGALMSMVTGARQVLTETFDPGESLDLIETEKATLLYGFDTHFKDLVELQDKSPRDISSIRTGILAAGMSNTTPIARMARKTLGVLFTGFGMSEFGVGATLSFYDSTAEQACETSGYPAPGYAIRVIDPETGKDQPPGEPGEILVKGYMVTQGYYNKPEETAKVMDAEGWFHTGDMGILRPDGYLRFMGRYKDMLKIGGENVDPMEVEALLLGHPGVHQVAVVGFPDLRLAEVAVGFVQPVPESGVTPADIIAYCKGKVASFKVPRHVIFVEEFPMTGSGKIQKVKLREAALQQLPGKT